MEKEEFDKPTEQENIDFLSSLENKTTEDIMTQEKHEELEKKEEKQNEEKKETVNEVKKEKKTKSSTKNKNVNVITSSEYEIQNKKDNKKQNISNSVEINENFELENDNNIEYFNENDELYEEISSNNKLINKFYEKPDSDKIDKKISIRKTEEIKEDKKEIKKKENKKDENIYHGGEKDKYSSFKTRSSHVSKIMKEINVENTEDIESVDITKKSVSEQQKIYLDTVLPALNPTFSIVPLVVSGVVISMTSFWWTDVLEICKIDEELDYLDPNDSDYIYKKNKIFLKKRRRQLDLFYEHIYSVSGFKTVPSKEKFYREIVKFPDFQQLFFAALTASFKRDYEFTITCNSCNSSDLVRKISTKKICFLLNKNISIDDFNKILIKGATIGTDEESVELYNEFKSLNFVSQCNKKYTSKKPLSETAIIPIYEIPSIYNAYDKLEQIIETFKNKPLEYNTSEGDTISIDSSFGLTDEMLELRSYLYIKSLQVGRPIEKDDEIQITYFDFEEPSFIINTIKSLTMSDYKELISDINLRKLTRVNGIRHALDLGTCEKCEADLGRIPMDPETLFFMIGLRESAATKEIN